MTNENDPSRTSHRSDPGWKHCHLMDESNLNKLILNYCWNIMKGGVTRAKEHLMTNKGNVATCTKTPKNMREELWKLYKEKADNSSVNPRYTATMITMRVKMRLKFPRLVMIKGEILVEEKDQWICFLEIQLLQ